MSDYKLHTATRWRCHRGMLELDLLLLPFFDARFKSLSAAQQQQFIALLETPDPELFAALMGHEIISDLALADMVRTIQHFHRHAL